MIELLLVVAIVEACIIAYCLHQSRPSPDSSLGIIESQSELIRELIDRLTSMRREGFVPAPTPAPLAAQGALPLGVQRALDAVDEPGLESEVRRWLDSGLEEDVVIEQILAGGNVP